MNGAATRKLRYIAPLIARSAGTRRVVRQPSAIVRRIGSLPEPTRGGIRTIDAAIVTAKKLTTLHTNAVVIPQIDMTTPAITGPSTRPRFHWTELRPIADGTSAGGTMSGTDVCHAGKPIAPPQPLSSARTAIHAGVARPLATIHVRMPAIEACTSDALMINF